MASRHPEILTAFAVLLITASGPTHVAAGSAPSVPLQPFADQVRQLESALSFLGQPLSPGAQGAINAGFSNPDPEKAVSTAESVLDKYALAVITINAES
ncbi:MAG TPA: hypothetical protein VI455_03990, partial [Terriglobia bacterium]